MKLQRESTHPGEILLEEFIAPLGLTQAALAASLGVSFRTINELVNLKRAVSPEMALRLSKYFGTTPELWMNLQIKFDLYKTAKAKEAEINSIHPRAV